MTNHASRMRMGWLVAAAVTLLSAPSSGQQPAAAKNETAARLEEMGRIVRSIALFRDEPGARRPVEMRPEPLHRWSDPTRGFSDGALWAWGGAGRPVALTTLELYPLPTGEADWSIEMISLAPGPLDAEGRGRSPELGPSFRWVPSASGLEMKPVPGTPKPASTEPARLRQAREIAERFTAEEVNRKPVERRYVLRLLPRPIYRYSDPAAAILDGAFFIFANGTNPEILLLVEARGEGPLAAWSYGTARLSRAAPELFLDGQQVWSLPYAAVPGPRDPYYTMRMRRVIGD